MTSKIILQSASLKPSALSSRQTISFSKAQITPTSRIQRNIIRAQATADAQSNSVAAYPAWDSIYKQLTLKYGVKSVSPDEAAIMIDEGKAVLIDVRLADDFEESHAKGAVSCPAFRIIKAEDGGGMGRMMKLLVMKANGVVPTEASPLFPELVTAAVGSDKIAILACEAGGSATPTSSFPTGKASRSLKAAWKLLHLGILPADRVMHLDGGVLGWYNAGLQMEGEYNTARAGRSPNVVKSE